MRIPELINHLEESLFRLTKEWITKHSEELKKEIKSSIESLEINNSEITSIVITYLRSSALTNSHKFMILCFKDEIFLDEPIEKNYFTLYPQLVIPDEKLKRLFDELTPPFFQISAYEKEEIRRHLIIKIYIECANAFKETLEDKESENSQIPVFFGEEMGELIQIGVI